MAVCDLCKKATQFSVGRKLNNKYVTICEECDDRLEKERIASALEEVNHPSDFKNWKMADMSEAFWTHLAIYHKCPNKKSLSIMNKAILWACHANHGLSNSFFHALDWLNIDLWKEQKRTDLPEKGEE